MSKMGSTLASINNAVLLIALRTRCFLSCSMMIIVLVITSGCPQQNSQAAATDQKKQEIAQIEDNINNAHARLAAQRSDVCPKLLQKEVDSNVIKRVQEVMTSDYCDYYLYPQVNQHIAVTLSDANVEALLIVPTLHNFANGDYRVDSYDKHIIRLAYTGITCKPEDFSYDVMVELID